ncbi:hypothetical protein D3C85_1392460 [compost metagenome]
MAGIAGTLRVETSSSRMSRRSRARVWASESSAAVTCQPSRFVRQETRYASGLKYTEEFGKSRLGFSVFLNDLYKRDQRRHLRRDLDMLTAEAEFAFPRCGARADKAKCDFVLFRGGGGRGSGDRLSI